MDLRVRIGGVTFKNPVWAASGTFGYGEEFADFLDLEEVGAIVTKTLTLEAREGNAPPRIAETASGLLNSIGLENKGIEHFAEEYLPRLKKLKTRVIVSIAGLGRDEFAKVLDTLLGKGKPDAVEVNLSCPNVKHRGMKRGQISQDPRATESIISSLKRRNADCPLIAKLSPNVTDIGVTAKAAESGGADAVSLVNTYAAMAVDAENMKPVLGNVTGGLSGPAIKPMALKAVRDAYNSVDIPVIGVGGVMTGTDVAEHMLCGASCVQTGTVNFVDPSACKRILGEFKAYLRRKRIERARDLTGKLRTG